MSIINLTPHAITIVAGDDNHVVATMPPYPGGPARLKAETDSAGQAEFNGINIPLSRTVFGPVSGLPDREDDVFYIVSQLVKSAIPQRPDLVVPAEVVRDDRGNIIGCRSLGL